MGVNEFVDNVNKMILEENNMRKGMRPSDLLKNMDKDYSGDDLSDVKNSDDVLKKYCAEDIKAVNDVTVRMSEEERHIEKLREQTKAYSREEQLAVASVIKADVLLEVLEAEISRLYDFEDSVRKITS